jgi:hypothetical protein
VTGALAIDDPGVVFGSAGRVPRSHGPPQGTRTNAQKVTRHSIGFNIDSNHISGKRMMGSRESFENLTSLTGIHHTSTKIATQVPIQGKDSSTLAVHPSGQSLPRYNFYDMNHAFGRS